MTLLLLCAALLQETPEESLPADRFPLEVRAPVRVLEAAVVRIEFPDRPLSDGCGTKRKYEEAAEYYGRQSRGVLEWKVRFVGDVTVKMPRSVFARSVPGGVDEIFFVNAVKKAASVGNDRILLELAGRIGRPESVLWPHSGSFPERGRDVNYALLPEETRGCELGALAHEIGHLLGLPDQYGIDAPAGELCLMGTGYLGAGRDHDPGPLCASCLSRLGWIPTHTLTPGEGRTIRLDPGLALRIPLTRSSSESLLLETRPGRGLVVWHEEGIRAPGLVGVFPTADSDRLTPYSDPPFRARTVGSRAVYLTEIRFERGSALLEVGSSAPLTPQEELRRSRLGRVLGGR